MKLTKLDVLYIACIILSPACFVASPLVAHHNIHAGICLFIASIVGAVTIVIYNHFEDKRDNDFYKNNQL